MALTAIQEQYIVDIKADLRKVGEILIAHGVPEKYLQQLIDSVDKVNINLDDPYLVDPSVVSSYLQSNSNIGKLMTGVASEDDIRQAIGKFESGAAISEMPSLELSRIYQDTQTPSKGLLSKSWKFARPFVYGAAILTAAPYIAAKLGVGAAGGTGTAAAGTGATLTGTNFASQITGATGLELSSTAGAVAAGGTGTAVGEAITTGTTVASFLDKTSAFLDTTAGKLLVTGGLALAEGFFSDPAEVPNMSPEEKEMALLNLENMRSASAEDKAMKPLLLQQMGIIENPDGTYRQMTEEERVAGMTVLQEKQYQVTGLELDRQITALKGELPLTVGTQQRYDSDREQFETEMQRRLGPAWKTSTPGIQAEEAFESRWGLLKDEERYSQLGRGTSAISSQFSLTEKIPAVKASQYAAFPQRRMGLLSGYSQAAEPFQTQRYLGYQGDVRAETRRAGLLQDIGYNVGEALYGRRN